MSHEGYRGLPGGELVQQGLADLAAGVESEYSWLLLSAASRLRYLGILLPDSTVEGQREHRLYQLLLRQYGDDAYFRLNALTGRLISFAECLEREQSKA